jgi:predicted alpha/beta superfamily hydrolase
MHKFIIIVFVAFFSICSNAQLKLSIRFKLSLLQTDEKNIFLAGSFNNWSPNNALFSLEALLPDTVNKNDKKYTLNLPKGQHEFKFTKGNWDNVECDKESNDVANRKINLQKDTTIEIANLYFKTKNKTTPKSTLTGKLDIISMYDCTKTAKRNIRVWTPINYPLKNIKYKVLYMLDGQNLFDNVTAPYGEWGIDEALDSAKNNNIIVVGIDHANESRIKEYLPYSNIMIPNNYGSAFMFWVVNDVKKMVDEKYKKYIYTDAPNTYIAGSSMGGLIAFYGMANYPNVFGKAGIFSPAFWLGIPLEGKGDCNFKTNTDTALCFDITKTNKNKNKLYFYAGLAEDVRIVEPYHKVLNKIDANIVNHIEDKLGEHNEPTWRKQLPAFLKFLNQ